MLYLNITKPNQHLEKHLPPFEATHSSSDIHGDVKKKGKSTRFSPKKTKANSKRTAAVALATAHGASKIEPRTPATGVKAKDQDTTTPTHTSI
jgi:hypothetical protein